MELIMDFSRKDNIHKLFPIKGVEMECVTSVKILGIHISQDLPCLTNCSYLVKKARQQLFFHLLFFWTELNWETVFQFTVLLSFLLQHACTALHYCTSNLHILHFFVYTSCIYSKSIYIVYSVLYIIAIFIPLLCTFNMCNDNKFESNLI